MKPMFRRIADDLRGRILSGELQAGARLPTLEALMADYGTTSITARRALEELAREGLTETRPTVGTFVRDLRRHRLGLSGNDDDSAAEPFAGLADRLLKALADGQLITVRAADIITLTPPTGLAMRIGTGPVLHRCRTFMAGAAPIATGNDYFTVASGLGSYLEAAAPHVELFDLLDDAGVRPERVVEEMLNRMPGPDEIEQNGWPVGMPVLVQMRTAYMPTGEPVACTTKVLPGDRWVAVQERPYPAVEPRIRAVV